MIEWVFYAGDCCGPDCQQVWVFVLLCCCSSVLDREVTGFLSESVVDSAVLQSHSPCPSLSLTTDLICLQASCCSGPIRPRCVRSNSLWHPLQLHTHIGLILNSICWSCTCLFFSYHVSKLVYIDLHFQLSSCSYQHCSDAGLSFSSSAASYCAFVFFNSVGSMNSQWWWINILPWTTSDVLKEVFFLWNKLFLNAP